MKELHLQEKLCTQNFPGNVKKLQEPPIDTIKKTAENLTKTITEVYNNNNKAIENSKKKGWNY